VRAEVGTAWLGDSVEPRVGKLGRRVSVASLFSGAGGLDLGFVWAGAELVSAYETDESARLTFEANLGKLPSNTRVEKIGRRDLEGADIVIAGPPCQGFTNINSRPNTDDRRNQLFLATAKLIAGSRPRLFVIENVGGLLWRGKGSFLRRSLGILERAGMKPNVIKFDCMDVGVPQRRRRVLIVGGRGREGQDFARLLSAEIDKPRPRVTVSSVLIPVPKRGAVLNHLPPALGPNWYQAICKHIGEGQKLCDTRLGSSSVHSWEIPEVFGSTNRLERTILETIALIRRRVSGRRYLTVGDGRAVTERQVRAELSNSEAVVAKAIEALIEKGFLVRPRKGYVNLARLFNGRFKRIPLNGVSSAVTRDFGSARNTLHPVENRGLSVRECARLQGFPDDFEFLGSVTQQYSQVANAFPPPISEIIAEAALLACGVPRRRAA
jgi:DNA (cytosine-5)-methyltransferase 1